MLAFLTSEVHPPTCRGETRGRPGELRQELAGEGAWRPWRAGPQGAAPLAHSLEFLKWATGGVGDGKEDRCCELARILSCYTSSVGSPAASSLILGGRWAPNNQAFIWV